MRVFWKVCYAQEPKCVLVQSKLLVEYFEKYLLCYISVLDGYLSASLFGINPVRTKNTLSDILVKLFLLETIVSIIEISFDKKIN